MDNNNNFVAAVLISIMILVGFHYFYEKPHLEQAQKQMAIQKQAQLEADLKQEQKAPDVLRPRDEVLKETKRVQIQTPTLDGSLNLTGARFDDLQLIQYRETVDPTSPEIVLLSPKGSEAPHTSYIASFGWLASKGIKVPGEETVWKADAKILTPKKPLHLTWNNGRGLIFERTIAVDDGYLFTISDRVRNQSGKTVKLYPYGYISRRGKAETQHSYVMHEGPIGVLDGTLKEVKYDDLIEEGRVSHDSDGGWLGITDKYWLVSLLPDQKEKLVASFNYAPSDDPTKPEDGVFQTDYRAAPIEIAAGDIAQHQAHLFAGAKRVKLLDRYEDQLGLPLFDRAIDFGWYYYLTKPFLYFLEGMNGIFGSMAMAIVILTVILRLITLPLSLKSNRSMAKMKALQPELKALQDKYKDDRQQLGIQTMELYKREKVSPVSGCVPMLFQIPIFFALYKVLYVGIELRHAPLFGWVKDMSAPDPLSVLTGFGLVDWSFIPHMGVWPILMGISMFMQQKMSPQPTDSSQAKAFQFLPILFTFMLANMAVGLIFYWTISNILAIGQQWYIMRTPKGGART